MRSSAVLPLLQIFHVLLQLAPSAIAIEYEIETVDAVHLLQASAVLYASATSNTKNSTVLEWFDWNTKFQGLAKLLEPTKRLTPPDEPSEFSTDEAAGATSSGLVKVWGHLGDNLWMETLDGQFHKKGPHAIDNQWLNERSGFDGQFSLESRRQYERFLNESEWRTKWTAQRLAESNAGFAGQKCNSTSCDQMYFHTDDSGQSWKTPDGLEQLHGRLRMDLDLLLADYYRLVSPLDNVNTPLRLQLALPTLAHFYLKLAYTHPFDDGNTRTRVLFLNTELVRLGGHPVILWDFRESQELCHTWWYYNHSFEESCVLDSRPKMEQQILEGWCAWEVAALTGASPFQSGKRRKVFDSETGTCI